MSLFCRITDSEGFQPSDDAKETAYNELYFHYAYAFQKIAAVLAERVGEDISANVRERLAQFLSEEAPGRDLRVCSYLACRDDGEVDLTPIHLEIIERYRSLILPVLSDGKVLYAEVDSPEVLDTLTESQELKIDQVDITKVPTVPLASVTHMLVPGIPLMTEPPEPQHTGWIMPRHPSGYDWIMSSARKQQLPVQFVGIGVCPHFTTAEQFLEDVLKKPKLDALVTPAAICTF
jgi:hypothetical protein